jgi:hypothetical protein
MKITVFIALMMEAASTSVTSVNLHQTTQRNIPEGSHLHVLFLPLMLISFGQIKPFVSSSLNIFGYGSVSL